MATRTDSPSNSVDTGQTSSSAVLERLAALADAKHDAALARALRVNPQTLSNWRQRGTVPYAAAVDFAIEHGVSLDYVLAGKGTTWDPYGDVAQKLLAAVIDWTIEHGQRHERSGFWAAQLWRRIVRRAPPNADPVKFVNAELEFLSGGIVSGLLDEIVAKTKPAHVGKKKRGRSRP